MNDALLYAADRGVVTLTLNRPKALNAINPDLAEGLALALDRIESDRTARAVIVTGAGDGFMAGGDIKFFTGFTAAPPAERRVAFARFIRSVHPSIVRLRRLRQPVIAAVHGPCAGFGMSLMMAGDLAIASAESLFTLAYRHVGAKQAMAIALLGDRFDAPKALALGLVNEIVPAAALAERATALARRLADGPEEAIAATKQLL